LAATRDAPEYGLFVRALRRARRALSALRQNWTRIVQREEICAERGISEATYYAWRDVLLDGASEALRTDPRCDSSNPPG